MKIISFHGSDGVAYIDTYTATSDGTSWEHDLDGEAGELFLVSSASTGQSIGVIVISFEDVNSGVLGWCALPAFLSGEPTLLPGFNYRYEQQGHSLKLVMDVPDDTEVMVVLHDGL